MGQGGSTEYVFFFVFCFFQLLSWMFQHVCLDTCCFEFLMHVFCIFVFAPVQCN